MENEEVNPLQQLINDFNEAQRVEAGNEYNIGMLLKDLEPYKDLFIDVNFDDGTTPDQFMSWRGRYNCLALDYYPGEDNHTSALVFYNNVKNTIGQTFEGYKGGDFTMDENTPIYQANYGECEAVRDGEWKTVKVVGVRKEENRIVLLTKIEED